MTSQAETNGGAAPFGQPNALATVLTVFIYGGTPPYTVSHGPGLQQTMTTNTSPIGYAFLAQDCGAVWPYPGPYPYQVVDAVGCISSGNASQGTPGAIMELAGLTRVLQVELDNTVSVRFENPPQGACPTYLPAVGTPWFSYLNYTLSRNGAPYQSGVVANVVNGGLVFGHLPPGTYLWQFTWTGNSSSVSPRWWFTTEHSYTMDVPGASDTGVNVDVAAALGGALFGATMSDGLRTSGVLPLTEPYSGLGYSYIGTAPGTSMDPGLLAISGTSAIVDWAVLELRASTAPYAVIASRPALIRRDGEVVDLDGDPYVNFPGLASGSYRVALRHRNHLGVMTGTAFSLGFAPVRVDFRSMATTYGTNAQMISSIRCLWPGDCAADGTIRYVGANNDRDPILSAIGGSMPTNVVNNVYSPMDVNMDGVIRYVGASNDRDPILQTVGGSVPTATRVQQLP